MCKVEIVVTILWIRGLEGDMSPSRVEKPIGGQETYISDIRRRGGCLSVVICYTFGTLGHKSFDCLDKMYACRGQEGKTHVA